VLFSIAPVVSPSHFCIQPQIRGLSVPEAIAQMEFSDKVRGPVVAGAVKQAAKRADFYHDLTPNELMIDQAIVGKDGQGIRKLRYHSRGRFGISVKRWSRVTVTVREMSADESAALLKFKPGTAPPRIHNAEARAY
jgi:large subunit ribosomal protein L22